VKLAEESAGPSVANVAASVDETNCDRMRKLGEIAREKKLPTTITAEEFEKR
jgi:hypothetical protein